MHDLHIGNIIPLRLDDLKQDGLSLNFRSFKYFTGLRWNKTIPFGIGISELTVLELVETLF